MRIGSALFNADHARLGEELRRVEAAGVDFIHLDVFDGYAVPDQGFPARTIAALRPLTQLPFEVHLTASDPLRFVPALADAGVDLIFLPAETTPLLYEAIYALRERRLEAGVCLALGTPLEALAPVLPMIDAALLLGRVTGEGARGRRFNDLALQRVARVRGMIDALFEPQPGPQLAQPAQAEGTERGAGGRARRPDVPQARHGFPTVDLQAAGGLEAASCVEACRLGATSLPLGSALHRAQDQAAYVGHLRSLVAGLSPEHERGAR